MGQRGKHRALVRAALFWVVCFRAAPVQACRLALVLALDVSSSVDATEDQLQRAGLAAALRAPAVQEAFFVSADPTNAPLYDLQFIDTVLKDYNYYTQNM